MISCDERERLNIAPVTILSPAFVILIFFYEKKVSLPMQISRALPITAGEGFAGAAKIIVELQRQLQQVKAKLGMDTIIRKNN
jgi:hypothetical protein